VIGFFLGDRIKDAVKVQKILADCGCYIKTRIGLHGVTVNLCPPSGLILLELFGGDDACTEVEAKLKKIKGFQVQKMVSEA
jgi:uncharacterized protein YwlG (UPF0340 family)